MNYLTISPMYKVQETDVLEDILGMRRSTLKRKMSLLEQQIEQRKLTLEENLYQIERDVCACNTAAMQSQETVQDSIHGTNDQVIRDKLPLYKEKRSQTGNTAGTENALTH